MQRLELPEAEARAQAGQLVPSDSAEPKRRAGAPRSRTPRSGFWIRVVAIAVTLCWIGGAAAFLAGYLGLARFGLDLPEAFAYLAAQLDFIGWFVLAAILILPTAFVWMTAAISVRSMELSRQAQDLARITERLISPDGTASRKVARLGHAVRREIDTLNAGVEDAMERIAKLRGDVHDEASRLQGAAADTEDRARKIRASLAQERAALGAVVERLESESELMTRALAQRTDALMDGFAVKTSDLVESIDAKSADIRTALERLGGDVGNVLSVRADEAAKKLETQAAKMSGAFDAAGDAVLSKLEARTIVLAEDVKAAGSQFIDSLDEQGVQSRQAFAAQADDLRREIAKQQDSFNASLSELRKQFATNLEGLASSIARQGNGTLQALTRLSVKVLGLIDEKGAEVTDRFDAKMTQMVRATRAAASEFEDASQVLARGAGDLEARAKDMVDRARAAGGELAAQAGSIEETSRHAFDQTASITARYGEQRDALDAAAARLAAENDRLRALLTDQKDVLDSITALVGSETVRMKAQIGDAADAFRATIADLTTRSASAREALSSQTADAKETGESVRAAFAATAKTVEEAARAAQEALESGAQSMNERMSALGPAADAALTDLNARFKTQASALQEEIARSGLRAQETARGAQDNIVEELEKLTKRMIESADTVEMISGRFAATVRAANEAAQTATQQLEAGLKDLETRMAGFPEQTQASVRQMREIFDTQISSFGTAAAEAAENARALDEAIRAKLQLNYDTLGRFLFGSVGGGEAGPSGDDPWARQPDLVAFRPASARGDGGDRARTGLGRAGQAPTPPGADDTDRGGERPRPQVPATSDDGDDTAASESELAQRLAARLNRTAPSAALGAGGPGAAGEALRESTGPVDDNSVEDRAVEDNTEPDRLAAAISGVAPVSPGEPPAPGDGDAVPSKPEEPAQPQARRWRWRDILAAADSNEDIPPPEAANDPKELEAIDSLYALTLELSRALDDTMPVPLVRRYLKGEKDLFARRLTDGDKNKIIARMKSKYEGDGGFRSHADRYMATFDTLMTSHDGAVNGSSEDRLHTSEGQVYLMLREAAGQVF